MPPENDVSDENGEYYIGNFVIEPNHELEKDLKRVVAERIRSKLGRMVKITEIDNGVTSGVFEYRQ
jgi:hypothetical protein